MLIFSTMTSFYGQRLMSKGALFHYLEREYAVNLLNIAMAVNEASVGKPQDKAVIVKKLKHSQWITGHVDSELFGLELVAFRMIGFGAVIDLPRDSGKRVDGLLG